MRQRDEKRLDVAANALVKAHALLAKGDKMATIEQLMLSYAAFSAATASEIVRINDAITVLAKEIQEIRNEIH